MESQEITQRPLAKTLSPGEEYIQIAKEYPTYEHVDWRHAPLKWKLYRHCPTISLGSPAALPVFQEQARSLPLSVARLGQLLAAIYGLTRQHWVSAETLNLMTAGSTIAPLDPIASTFKMELLRPVPSGGGLFPAEIYLVLAPNALERPLAAGLYHYDALHHALDLLDPTPMQSPLVQILPHSHSTSAPITLLLTCSFWKTAFKYAAFSYRLHSQDLGALIAQCLEVARAAHLVATVHYQFLDDLLNQQIGLDPSHESVYAVITLASPSPLKPMREDENEANNAKRPQPSVLTRTRSISEFPLLAALHDNALYHKRSELRPPGGLAPPTTPPGELIPISSQQTLDLIAGLKHRHSARNAFQPGALSNNQFTQLLRATTGGYENDLDEQPQALQHILLYCLVNRVEGIAPGAYCYAPTTGDLVLIRTGDLRAEQRAAIPPLNAHNVYQASLYIFPVGCYTDGFHVYGDRWYRMQNMESGLFLQRLYLAAAALGVGCHANLTYSVEMLDRLLQLPDNHTTLAQVLLAPEKIAGQFYELPLNY